MKSSSRLGAAALRRWTAWATVGLVALMSPASITPRAQSPPPVQGTVALEGTMKTFYRAANTVVVATIDGMEHVYHFTRDLVVHGGRGTGVDALEGLSEGSRVVIHYTVQGTDQSASEIDRVGDEGLKVTEGTVTRIARGRKQITVMVEKGRTETFLLTDRAAAEAPAALDEAGAGTTRVVIYYQDEAGRKVVHFFRKAS